MYGKSFYLKHKNYNIILVTVFVFDCDLFKILQFNKIITFKNKILFKYIERGIYDLCSFFSIIYCQQIIRIKNIHKNFNFLHSRKKEVKIFIVCKFEAFEEEIIYSGNKSNKNIK